MLRVGALNVFSTVFERCSSLLCKLNCFCHRKPLAQDIRDVESCEFNSQPIE